MPFSPSLPQVSGTTADLALLGLYVIALIYLTYTIILCYHWQSYSVDTKVTTTTLVSYFGLTLPLMITLSIVTLSL